MDKKLQTQAAATLQRWATAHWAIDRRALQERLTVLASMARGEASSVTIEGDPEAATRSTRTGKAPKVAVIPIAGIIEQKETLWTMMGFDTSTEAVGRELDSLIAGGTKTIVLDVDSPGGIVYGVGELSKKIYDARQKAKIVAIANPMAGSAAYHLASQAEELHVLPSGEVGSIGVFTMHVDASRMLEDMGWDVTFIHAGEYKVEGNSFEPASKAFLEFQQGRVDEYYDEFVSAVARGRGVTPTVVKRDFGKGRMYGAKQAKSVGMVDRVGTLEDVLRRTGAEGMRAEGEASGVTAGDLMRRRRLKLKRQAENCT